MSAYSEKLRDPRWQKRRLEIMSRDDFECQRCLDTETTLNVHHLWYSGEPWEAPDRALVTLCEPCHSDETYTRGKSEAALLQALRALGALSGDLDAITAGLTALATQTDHIREYDSSAIGWFISSPHRLHAALMAKLQEFKQQGEARCATSA